MINELSLLDLNEIDLYVTAAETGADRELDYCPEIYAN